jgi:hypothetical protein
MKIPTPKLPGSGWTMYKLNFAAINVNIKKKPNGYLVHCRGRDKGMRDRAVEMIKKGKDFAKAVGHLMLPAAL